MNIFVLDCDPEICASYHCDKHVLKMIVETSQLLSNCFPEETSPYVHTHMNHPVAKWVRETSENYKWTYRLLYHLIREYRRRWPGRDHACQRLLGTFLDIPKELQQAEMTRFALAMPDEMKSDDPVASYREYYWSKLADMEMKWTTRQIPNFMLKG